jgi:predicted lipase
VNIGTQIPLIKLHQNGGQVAPREGMTGWNLMNGSLIYTHRKKHGICNVFKGEAKFSVYDSSFDTYESTKFILCMGTYEGKTERFSAMNYLHQRVALLDSFGQTGVKPFDAVMSKVKKVQDYPDTLARFIVNPKTKFFAAFYSEKYCTEKIMHNQKSMFAVTIKGKKTLGQIFAKYHQLFLQVV